MTELELERSTLRRVNGRILPFVLLLYIIAMIDRTNVGFAALQMNEDLGFSASVYGFGAGVFFLCYALFEVPSNLILARVGARRWIARILFTWGLFATAMMFVDNATTFYILRFLLGVAEAGFLPGILYYLSFWYPAAQRAQAVSWFMIGIPLAQVIGAPLAGLLLSLDGFWGLHGWQWMYLIEGLPAILLTGAVLLLLTDHPDHADWLTPCTAQLAVVENPGGTCCRWRAAFPQRSCRAPSPRGMAARVSGVCFPDGELRPSVLDAANREELVRARPAWCWPRHGDSLSRGCGGYGAHRSQLRSFG